MARSRVDFQYLLETCATHVYFQPPPNVTMQYPCIVYKRAGDNRDYADNALYRHAVKYEVTVIDRQPDGPLWDAVADLPLCSFDRHFASDDLNHDVFTVFF